MNPHSMFDVKGDVALITGASGAFGMVAARVLAGAGCNLVLAAGNQEALDEIADECRQWSIDLLRFLLQIAEDIVVHVPALVEELDKADSPFDESTSQEAVVGKARFSGFGTVHVQRVPGLR